MSTLNYKTYANVTSNKDILLKFKEFAEHASIGWTITDYRTNVQWGDIGGGVYGWVSGSEDYLQITSAGYGAQELNFRFQTLEDAGDSQNTYIETACRRPGESALDTTSSARPTDYSYDERSGGMSGINRISLKDGTMNKLYLFGNSKILIAVVDIDGSLAQVFFFGSIEVFDATEIQCNYGGIAFDAKWYDYVASSANHRVEFNEVDNTILKDGNWNAQKNYRGLSVAFGYTDVVNADALKYAGYSNVINRNNYSGKRVIVKPIVYIFSSSVWRPYGTLPIYPIEFTGLTIGQNLIYGTDEYLCFPNCGITRKYGFAINHPPSEI